MLASTGSILYMDKETFGELLPTTMKGLTMIELLAILTIFFILSAIGIANLLDAQAKSKNARAASDTRTAVTQCIGRPSGRKSRHTPARRFQAAR
jgi:hypothetical protein